MERRFTHPISFATPITGPHRIAKSRDGFAGSGKSAQRNKYAKVLIASAIAAETYFILKFGEPFNRERLIRNLQRLPDQSFDNE